MTVLAVTDTPWLTVKDAAARARCGRASILAALADESLRGHRPPAKNPGEPQRGRWRIHVDDLDAWLRGETAQVRVQQLSGARRHAS